MGICEGASAIDQVWDKMMNHPCLKKKDACNEDQLLKFKEVVFAQYDVAVQLIEKEYLAYEKARLAL